MPSQLSASRRTPRAAAALAGLAGVVNLVSVIAPGERERLRALANLLPGAVVSTATMATAAAGIALLLLSGGLRRRRRSALVATVVLLLGSAVGHLVKGLDFEEALLEAFLAGVLVGKADRFGARRGATERQPVLRPAAAVVLVTFGYGLLGLAVNGHSVVGRLSFGRALADVGRMATGLAPTLPLAGRFGRFFPGSVAATFLAGGLVVMVRALGPSLVRRHPDPRLPELAAASEDSLAYFALRDDRATVEADGALISYGTVGTVLLAAGDPLGPEPGWPAAVQGLLAEAAGQGRVAAVIACGERAAKVYEQAGLRSLYLGDEGVLDLAGFSLEGRAVRIARQSWNRARRAGFTSQVWRVRDLDADTVAALRAISRHWRGDAAERGFSMALGRLFDGRDGAALVVVARDGTGRLRGFLHFVPWGADGASLDVMRRDRQAPAILNDFLVVEAARRLPELGVRHVSLNFSFLRAVLAAAAEPGTPWGLRVQRTVLLWLSRPFQIETLYRFNKKFDPAWQARYLAVEAVEDLPRVALAALRLEGLVGLPRRPAPGRISRLRCSPVVGCDAPARTASSWAANAMPR